jgi:hypothetical protein
VIRRVLIVKVCRPLPPERMNQGGTKRDEMKRRALILHEKTKSILIYTQDSH